MRNQLFGKVALLTDATTLVSRAIAQALADCGAVVALNYVGKSDFAIATANTICASGGKALAIQANIADQFQVKTMFAEIDEILGEVEILINCGGMHGDAELDRNSDTTLWGSLVDISLTGAFYCAQHALVRMAEKRSGAIVNVTSARDALSSKALEGPASSHIGLAALSNILAQEFSPHGIRIVALVPTALTVAAKLCGLTSLPQLLPFSMLEENMSGMHYSSLAELGKLTVKLVSAISSAENGATVFTDGVMAESLKIPQAGMTRATRAPKNRINKKVTPKMGSYVGR